MCHGSLSPGTTGAAVTVGLQVCHQLDLLDVGSPLSCRFTAEELLCLANVFDLPNPMITSASQYRASAVEALALLCTQLRSPEDLMSLSTKYAWCATVLLEIINDTAQCYQLEVPCCDWHVKDHTLTKCLFSYLVSASEES